MTVSIPEDKVSELKNAVDILDIVSETVILKKTGQNYQGLCPFHAEKTPSFSVSPAKQIFYCFGCGAGGDVFRFIMKKDGLTFPEALQVLSRRTGIELPTQHLSNEQKQRISEREKMLAVNYQAMEFFHNYLKGPEGANARRYLERRGLSEEIINRFKIGLAPDGWDGLARFFRDGMAVSLGEKLGLLKPRREKNGHYDCFRNRVIFPIFDSAKRVIGFGGRVMDDSLPKYLNSPESAVYNKRRSLYGVHVARPESLARECVFVVEGYFDVLALHRHNIPNSVATLGTALTPEHLQTLKGFIGTTGHVVLVFDSDEAGLKAAERSVEVFSRGFVDARILVLPKGHDPDSFLLQFGRDDFLDSANKAKAVIPFLIEASVKRHGVSTDGKIRIVEELKGVLASIEDGMARSLHIRDLAEKIEVDETAIIDKVKIAYADNRVKTDRAQVPFRINGSNLNEVTENVERGSIRPLNRLERRLISMMLQFPAILPEIGSRDLLSMFEDSELSEIGQKILSKIKTVSGKGQLLAADIMSSVENPETRNLIASLAIGDEPWEYTNCIKLIRQFEGSRKNKNKTLLNGIRAAEGAGDLELIAKLQMQLLKEKKTLSAGHVKHDGTVK